MNRAESPIRREQDLYFELLDFIQRPDDLRRGGGPDVGDHVDVWGPVANWICQVVIVERRTMTRSQPYRGNSWPR